MNPNCRPFLSKLCSDCSDMTGVGRRLQWYAWCWAPTAVVCLVLGADCSGMPGVGRRLQWYAWCWVTDHIYHSILIFKFYELENFAQYTIPLSQFFPGMSNLWQYHKVTCCDNVWKFWWLVIWGNCGSEVLSKKWATQSQDGLVGKNLQHHPWFREFHKTFTCVNCSLYDTCTYSLQR
jgi:hypothetical protein